MCVREKECMCVRERVCVCERERECMCVWECVCERERECMCVRERERVYVCERVCVCERERVYVCERESVCVLERQRERVCVCVSVFSFLGFTELLGSRVWNIFLVLGNFYTASLHIFFLLHILSLFFRESSYTSVMLLDVDRWSLILFFTSDSLFDFISAFFCFILSAFKTIQYIPHFRYCIFHH